MCQVGSGRESAVCAVWKKGHSFSGEMVGSGIPFRGSLPSRKGIFPRRETSVWEMSPESFCCRCINNARGAGSVGSPFFEIKGELHKMADAVRAVHSFTSQVAEETVFFREFCKTGKDFFIDILFHKVFLLSVNNCFLGISLVPAFCT